MGEDRFVTANTVNQLTPSISESKVVSNNSELNRQTIDYLCEIDLSDPNTKVVVGYGGDGAIYTDENYSAEGKWTLTATSQQAAAYEKATGNTVVAAINTDFFDMSNGHPIGALVINGRVQNGANGRPYFAILKSGEAVIRTNHDDLSDCMFATGGYGGGLLVQNGQNVVDKNDGYGNYYYTRCAVGIKSDGSVVLLSTEGMKAPISCGHISYEMADLLVAAGCETALLLDCGGSVTYLSRYEGERTLELRNNPSDGAERHVSTTLLVTYTAEATGVFDHASITPHNEAYTPGSAIAFSAQGIDAAGREAALPEEGLTWKVMDESFGTIDSATGVFVSSGKQGEVAVGLFYNDKQVGTSSVEIRQPDALAFESSSRALTYNAESDLGLSASYRGREVHLKDGDIAWTITEDSGNKLYEVFGAIGTFAAVEAGSKQSLLFKANPNKAYSGAAEICAAYYGDDTLVDTITVEVGKAPVKAMDFETVTPIGKMVWDPNCREFYLFQSGSDDPAAESYTPVVTSSFVNSYGIDPNGSVVGIDGTTRYKIHSLRGGNESAEYVTTSDPAYRDIIRFGNSALKLNYDFSGAVGIEGADFGYSREMVLDGSATGIGVWVYAPEGTPNLWLRMRVKVTTAAGTETVNTINFTARADQAHDANANDYGGINWTGWKYVSTDLSQYQGQGCTVTLLPGESIRVMYTNGAYGTSAGVGMGNQLQNGTYVAKEDCKGWLLFDNLTILYGTQTEDTTNPYIGNIYTGQSTGDLTLLDGATLTDSTIGIFAEMNDYEDTDENASGIVTRQLEIDGKLVGNMQKVDQYGYISDIGLANGVHSATVYVKDNNGNVITKTVTFTVEDPDSKYPTVGIRRDADVLPLLGQPYTMDLTSSMMDNTKQVDMTMELDAKFAVSDVQFHADYSGSTYTFANGVLTIHAVRNESAASKGEGTIAAIAVNVPGTLSAGTYLTYTVKSGQTVYVKEAVDGWNASFAGSTQRIPVTASYTLTLQDTMVVGAKNGRLEVRDAEGHPAAGVSVLCGDKTVGITDEQGIVTTDMFVKEVSRYTVQAVDEKGRCSFPVTFQSYPAAGESAPYYIQMNANKSGIAGKSITWLSNVIGSSDTAQVQYYTTNSQDVATARGQSKILPFSGSQEAADNTAVRVNYVRITGLKPDTNYHYRVGDGTTWSDWAEFTTLAKSNSTSFFLLGDTQSDDASKLDRLMKEMTSNKQFAFGAQLGDAVENPQLYDDWAAIMNVFSNSCGDIDMLHVVGNHELFGDHLGNAVSALFNLPDRSYYSVEYNNVYVATISYTEDRAGLSETLKWLVSDAKASDCPWKILVMHQPAYYTNPEGGSRFIYEALPAAVQEAGIQAVFAGHDHAYARTNRLTNDQIDNENGVVYYICGSTGEKSYAITSQNDFDYDVIFAQAHQNYTAIYLTVTADQDRMVIETHDLDNGVIDECIIETPCGKAGHQYLLNVNGDPLKDVSAVCAVCGYEDATYTGDIMDADGKEYRLMRGKPATGWVMLDSEVRFYDQETGVRGKVTKIENVATTCTVPGYYVMQNEAGETYKVAYTDYAGGHEYVESDGKMVCTVCGHTLVDMSECTIKLGGYRFTYTGKAIYPWTRAVAPDGTVLTNEGEWRDYYSTYANNVEVGTASVTLTAKRYGVYVDKNQWRGSYKGTATVEYTILPDLPTGVTTKTVNDGIKLSWNAAKAAGVTYLVQYRPENTYTWTTAGKTTDTSYTVTGLPDNMVYLYRLRTVKTVDGVEYQSTSYTIPVADGPIITVSVRQENGKPQVTWRAYEGAVRYRVYRADSENGIYKPMFTCTGTSYCNTSAEPGKTYYYKVAAIMSDGSSSFSSVKKCAAVCAIPVVKSGNNAVSGKPTLSWDRVAGAVRYEVYRATTENGTYSKYFTTTGTTYTNTSATVGNTYYYKVVAIGEKAELNATSKVISGICNCAQPVVKKGNNADSGKPTLSWGKVAGAVKYEVYRATTKNGTYSKYFTTTGTTYTNTSAAAGSTYYYKVKAVAANVACSAESNVIQNACYCAKPNVVCGNQAKTGLPTLAWNRVAGAVRYEVYRSESSNGTFTKYFTTTGTTYTNTSAKEGRTYYYKVKAVASNDAYSSFSAVMMNRVKK